MSRPPPYAAGISSSYASIGAPIALRAFSLARASEGDDRGCALHFTLGLPRTQELTASPRLASPREAKRGEAIRRPSTLRIRRGASTRAIKSDAAAARHRREWRNKDIPSAERQRNHRRVSRSRCDSRNNERAFVQLPRGVTPVRYFSLYSSPNRKTIVRSSTSTFSVPYRTALRPHENSNPPRIVAQ